MPPDLLSVSLNLERRQGSRVDLLQEISCAGRGLVVRSGVADLSVGGMFVETLRTPFPTGTLVSVRFSLRPDEPPLVLEAEVNYIQERIGMGMRFVGLEDAERERIAAFVEEALNRQSQGAPPVRKSSRVFVQLPIRVRGTRADGTAFDDWTSIISLSKHGACILCPQALEVGTRLLLDIASGRGFEGNVVWVGSEASHSEGQIGVKCRGLAQSLGFHFP
jgi:hypothetical protein